MRSCPKPQKAADNCLEHLDVVASSTQKPVECVFGMMKFRFSVLKNGFRSTHKDDCLYLETVCVILHNLNIANGNIDENEVDPDVGHELEPFYDDITFKEHPGNSQRNALLAYLLRYDG